MDSTNAKDEPLHGTLSTPLINDNQNWLDRLQCLSVRFSYLGIGCDLAALSLIEAWGLYLFLSRLAGD